MNLLHMCYTERAAKSKEADRHAYKEEDYSDQYQAI